LPAKSVKVRMPHREIAFRQEIKKIIFPTVYNDEDFFLDKNLKPIRVISIQKKELLTKRIINILFELMIEKLQADIFLILNGQKIDMYYSVTLGKYSFRNILLQPGKNILEIYYRVQMSKSASIFVTQTVK
jgi:hypothetical protein